MASFIMNVAFDCADPRSLARFWAGVTGYSVEFESDDVVRLKAPDSRGLRGMIFWRVPEPKTAKSRVHLDLASKNPQEEVSRLLSLGAKRIQQLPGWTVMADPEGNEFCLG
jgi:hypothetical protein